VISSQPAETRYHHHSDFDDPLMAGVDTTGDLSDPPQHHDDIDAGATGCDYDHAVSSAAIPTSQLRHCYEHIDGKINQQQETVKLSPNLLPSCA
jgi:hypothetical protein